MPPLIDGWITLDSALRRNDVPGIVLCPVIFEPSLLAVLEDEVALSG